jgi:hypothetical protein
MATLAYPANLQTSQAGNADSTNTIQRTGESARQMILRIVTNAGTTVTINIKGSDDGTTFYNVPYRSLATAGDDYSVAPLVITTAATGLYALMMGRSWNFLKLVQSANTGMTPTSDLL